MATPYWCVDSSTGISEVQVAAWNAEVTEFRRDMQQAQVRAVVTREVVDTTGITAQLPLVK